MPCTIEVEQDSRHPGRHRPGVGGLQAYPLHAADAIHLACALMIRRIAQEQGLPPPGFVVADTALCMAATEEEFVVDNPLQYP